MKTELRTCQTSNVKFLSSIEFHTNADNGERACKVFRIYVGPVLQKYTEKILQQNYPKVSALRRTIKI
ncbi:MAG: hypothetical protein IJU48_04275 [Synergistaceae bacterium]|nr:hypothetical protein [Synergistaceae bacterium]